MTVFVANSMQEFEIYGHCMQLGWGQEKRNGGLLNSKDSLGTKPGLKQCEKVGDVKYNTSLFTIVCCLHEAGTIIYQLKVQYFVLTSLQ